MRLAATILAATLAGPAPARDAIVATIKAHLGEVSACYQKALARKPWLAGRVVVNFSIAGAAEGKGVGRVGRVEIERTDVDDARFLACAQDAIRAWTFPASETPELSYPFAFGGGSARDMSVLVDGRPRPATLPARCELASECRALGASLAFGDEAEQARAFEYFSTGCALKDGASCAGAAAALDFGRGIAKDKRKAFALSARACGLRFQRACTTVAMTHAFGLDVAGVKRDPAKATAQLERACDAHEPVACLNLAERVRVGLGVARDEARASAVRARAVAD